MEREGSLSSLVSDGISTKPVWLEVKQQLIETTSNLEIYRNRLEEADASITAAEKDRENLIAQTKQQTLEELLDARNKFETAVITLRKAESREDRHQLRAPVSGTVQQLAVHTVRGVVSPAESLMVIVPDDVELEAVAKVQNKDAGFVATEQEAVIKIDSFPSPVTARLMARSKASRVMPFRMKTWGWSMRCVQPLILRKSLPMAGWSS